MIDVQSFQDARRIPIRNVGVRAIRLPIQWTCENSITKPMMTVSEFSAAVSLEAENKGTHMSRFLECIYEFSNHLSKSRLRDMAELIRSRLEAKTSRVEMSFDYFFEKLAPITKTPGIAEVRVHLVQTIDANGNSQLLQKVDVPVQTLCPCSKAISKFGAHNQRSVLTMSVKDSSLEIRDIIDIAEAAASSALFPLLKREDEKYVTEYAYENPKFVEDLVRDAAHGLKRSVQGAWFEVRGENFESIHNHNVWAVVCSDDL